MIDSVPINAHIKLIFIFIVDDECFKVLYIVSSKQ